MDEQTARRLGEMTTDFYARVAGSFSASRQSPWQGWHRIWELCEPLAHARSLCVLDLACGNLRFERYLADCAPDLRVRAWAVDACDELVGEAPAGVRYQHVDLAQSPFEVRAPACDLSVCFGFMHHLPMFEQRRDVLATMVAHTRPEGLLVCSFWQFDRDPRLRGKAVPLSSPGDYLLGWQDEQEVARYCHSFTEGEIDALVGATASDAVELERFSADGRHVPLNRYVVLRRR